MFETLTKGFRSAKQKFQGVAELDEATVDEALKDVRTSLLEADVGFDVVQEFCKRVREKAVGVIVKVKASTKEKIRRVSPEDHFVKLCTTSSSSSWARSRRASGSRRRAPRA